MKKKKIRSIAARHIKSINQAVKEIKCYFDEKEIHLYRVEIKKFGAFLQLIGFADRQKRLLKVPSKMRRFYKAIGLVRTLKIEENKIKGSVIPAGMVAPTQYLKIIAGRIKNAKELARDSVNKKNPFKKGSKRLLSGLQKNLSRSAVKEFVSTEVNRLNDLIGVVIPCDQSMHSIRKILKSLLYNRPFCKKDSVSMLKNLALLQRNQIVTLTEIIGHFQDLTTSLYLLRKDLSQHYFKNSEETVMKFIEQQWMSEKEKIRSDIYKNLTASTNKEKTLTQQLN